MELNTLLKASSSECAVWDGRFQPLHKGHVEFARAIIDYFDLPLVIMVIQSSESSSDDNYSKEVDRHHRLARNPLTLWERRVMLKLAIEEQGLSSRVEIVGIPRPDLFWSIASLFYPPNRFMCLSGKDDYERRKKTFWASLGERTKVVPTDGLTTVSASQVKAAIKEGGDWKSLIPRACHSYFVDINGLQRFAQADL